MDLTPEIKMRTSRSSGKGGQNVNKVSTRVELRFNVPSSQILTEDQKQCLLERLGSRLTRKGDLIIIGDRSRSQIENREEASARLHRIITKALKPPKKRIPTHKPQWAMEKKLADKKLHSEVKKTRRLDKQPPSD